jgi:hypothetical protein
MTQSELEEWLQTEDSASSGWSKNDGSGESVGHDSGRRIVEILKKNPDKDPGELNAISQPRIGKVHGWGGFGASEKDREAKWVG